MTEKIIIDGVNVAGCYWKCKDGDCAMYYADLSADNNELEFGFNCEDNPDCYFKQLKRAEIEIEKLKGVDGSVHPDSAYYKITRLEQENNSLQAQLNNITVQSNNAITALEQENKELKAYKNVNEDFKKAWDELNEKYKQLRSALEEIREIITNDNSMIIDKKIYFELQCGEPVALKLQKIYNKINEVLK